MHTKFLVFLLCTYTCVYAQNNWTCSALWFDDGYYCDCNCGIYDPDCNIEDSIDWGCENNFVCIGAECVDESIVDIIPPVIVLIGNASIDVANIHLYNELGATATDHIEGNITGLIAIGIHLASEGTYVVTYNVMDIAGNPAVEVTRTVNILSKEEELGEEELGEEELNNPYNVGDEECPIEGPGYIKDCSSETSCCPFTWIGDGLCDDENSIYGCDFSCIIEETVDCVPIPDDPIGESAAISLTFSTQHIVVLVMGFLFMHILL